MHYRANQENMWQRELKYVSPWLIWGALLTLTHAGIVCMKGRHYPIFI